jgi:acetyl esterase/lipase
MLKIFIVFTFIALSASSFSQKVYKLWEKDKMPFAKDNSLIEYKKEMYGTQCVFNVTEPTLTVYQATGNNSKKAVVILPGGGYSMLAMYHEGYEVAEALANQGITAAVLKYRLPLQESSDTPELLPITDTQKALEMMRSMSEKYGFDKNQVGVLGFSAGGHLAAFAASKEKERPDFSIVVYGCPRLTSENISWLEESLFHRKMMQSELDEFNLLGRIDENTPPAFLVHSVDDETCNYKETTEYAQKLRDNAVSVEVHLFPAGGHGFGLGRKEDGTDQWINLAINWIKRL